MKEQRKGDKMDGSFFAGFCVGLVVAGVIVGAVVVVFWSLAKTEEQLEEMRKEGME